MRSKKLDKHGRSGEVGRSKTITLIIQRSKNRNDVTDSNRIVRNLLRADFDRECEEPSYCDCQYCRYTTKPARADDQGCNTKTGCSQEGDNK